MNKKLFFSEEVFTRNWLEFRYIGILVAASIYSFSTTSVLPHGSLVLFPCLSVGDPKIYWKLPNGELLQKVTNDGNIRFYKDGSLQIMNVARQHRGNYECHATNKYGSDSLSYSLTVQGKKNIEQNSLKFKIFLSLK